MEAFGKAIELDGSARQVGRGDWQEWSWRSPMITMSRPRSALRCQSSFPSLPPLFSPSPSASFVKVSCPVEFDAKVFKICVASS